jgi:hypothetical protein
MDNPEKQATLVHKTQDEDKKSKSTTQLCVGHLYMKANTNNTHKT